MSTNEVFTDLGNLPLDQFKPTRGLALVKREALPDMDGAILLVETKDEDRRLETSTARVVSLGYEKIDNQGNLIAWQVNEGDRVLLTKFAGYDFKIEGEAQYVMLCEDDIIAVIEDDTVVG